MNPETENDADLTSAYRTWIDERAADPPSFEALAPKASQKPRVLTFPRILAGLAAAAAVVFSITMISSQPDSKPSSPPAAAERAEIVMSLPSETDFLLAWPSDLIGI